MSARGYVCAKRGGKETGAGRQQRKERLAIGRLEDTEALRQWRKRASMAAIKEESDYDSSRSSLTAPGSRRSWISDIGSSSSVSVRSLAGAGGGGWDAPSA
ncbi:hypothetical protein EJB05_31235, partial [Eragrostis curvula]